MSDDLRKALQKRLMAIPDGQIASVARRSGLTADRLRKLRRGMSLDVRLETLGRIAAALGEGVGYMLGEDVKSSDRPTLLPDCVAVPKVKIERVVKLLRKVSRLAQRMAEALPEEHQPPRRTRPR